MRHASIVRFLLLPCIFFCASLSSSAQSVWSLVNAVSTGTDCYQLTKNATHQRGAAWNNKMLNLKKPFELYFQFNFGSDDNGADGITVVLQNSLLGLSALGDDGYQIGYGSLSTPILPSLDIEFDTYDNAWPAYDIADDHCSINGNGSTSWEFAPAVPLLGAGVNVEDNAYHLVELTWQPSVYTLQVYFDCNLIQTLVKDITTEIFAGDSMVYYGLTAATGIAHNAQSFCELYLDAGSDSTFCPGTPVTLKGNSNFSSFSWAPSTGLSCTSCLNPVADPNGSSTYVLTGNFGCLTATDTMELTSNCFVLPIELTSFTAACVNNIVDLNWSTAAEFNNDYFVVERSSDALNYQMLTTVDGAGNSSSPHNYVLKDEQPLAGTNYYRLRQVDFDGTSTYSNVQSVMCNAGIGLFVYPNPSHNDAHLEIYSSAAATVMFSVTNMAGKIIFRQEIKLDEGRNGILLPGEQLTSGVYDVSVISGISLLHSLLVIQ